MRESVGHPAGQASSRAAYRSYQFKNAARDISVVFSVSGPSQHRSVISPSGKTRFVVDTCFVVLCRFAYSSMIMHGTLSSVAVGSGRAASALGHGTNTCPDTWLGPLLRDVEKHATGPLVCIFLHAMKDTITGRPEHKDVPTCATSWKLGLVPTAHRLQRCSRRKLHCRTVGTRSSVCLLHGRPGTDCGAMTTRSQRCGA